jgi:hypothetical protein
MIEPLEMERERESTGWNEDPNQLEWARQAVGLLDISSSRDWAQHGTTSGGVSNQRQKNRLIFFLLYFICSLLL